MIPGREARQQFLGFEETRTATRDSTDREVVAPRVSR
jgi:hypothetical protein